MKAVMKPSLAMTRLVVRPASTGPDWNGFRRAVHHPLVVMSAGSRTDVTSRPSVGIDHRMQMTTTAMRNGALRMNAGRHAETARLRSTLRAGAVMSRSPAGAGCGR